jgi:hypothetical protein
MIFNYFQEKIKNTRKDPDVSVSSLWCIGLCTITLTLAQCLVNEIRISPFRAIKQCDVNYKK